MSVNTNDAHNTISVLQLLLNYCLAGNAGRSPVLPQCDQLGGPRHGMCEGKLRGSESFCSAGDSTVSHALSCKASVIAKQTPAQMTATRGKSAPGVPQEFSHWSKHGTILKSAIMYFSVHP